MSATIRAVCVSLLACVSCVAPEQATSDARDAVRRDVDARLGTLPRDQPGVVADARIRGLLADGIDEDEAVRIALLSSRKIVAHYAELGVAAADLEQASLWANPVLDVGFLFFDDGTEIDLGLSQSLVDVLLMSPRKAAGTYALDAARARVAREIVAHAFATRRAYVTALAANMRLELERRHTAAAEASVGLMRRLAEAGNVVPSELALEESALALRLLDRSRAEAEYLDAREALTREMGLYGPDVEWTLSGTLKPDPAMGVDFERVESRAIAASLDLAERRAHANALAQEGEISRYHALLPDARIGIDAQKDVDGSGWGLGPSGSIGIPLTDSGKAREFAVNARLEAAAAELWAHAVEIRSLARTFRNRLRALDADARFSRDVHVPAERRVVRETLRNYNAMQIGAVDVLRAQGLEIAAERRGVELLSEAWKARLDLEELLAGRANSARLNMERRDGVDTTERGSSGGHG